MKTVDKKCRMVLALVLLVYGAVLVASNPYFNIIDDELAIVSAAFQPVGRTLQVFVTGRGQHEHPPLSDLILHFWLLVSPAGSTMLRLPFIAFFVLGMGVLAVAANEIAGHKASWALVTVGTLWPFGFHFGRMLGWYTVAFLLVSLLTYFYIRILNRPTLREWLLLVACALALLYTNYAGWALILLLAFDFLFAHRQNLRRYFLPTISTVLLLAAGFGPLWKTIERVLLAREASVQSLEGRFARAAFNGYSIFASESIAPWFMHLAIPICLGILTVIWLVLLNNTSVMRRLFVYWLGIVFVLSVANVLGTKRLLFLSPWLLLPMATALVSINSLKSQRRLLAIALAMIAGFAWYGMASRRYYSATHFIDPWPEVAKEVAKQVRSGALVIASQGPFPYYLQEALHPGKARQLSPESVRLPGGHFDVEAWWAQQPHAISEKTVLVETVADSPEKEEHTRSAEMLLNTECTLDSVNRYQRDSGYLLKKRLFPWNGQREWRIEVHAYSCSAPPFELAANE